jgi:hypothetical protein
MAQKAPGLRAWLRLSEFQARPLTWLGLFRAGPGQAWAFRPGPSIAIHVISQLFKFLLKFILSVFFRLI